MTEEIFISLFYDQETDNISFDDYSEEANACLRIWNDEQTKIKYKITTYHLKNNSRFYEKLMEYGWAYNEENYMVRLNKSTLIKIEENHEDNYVRLQEEFLRLIKNGLKINSL